MPRTKPARFVGRMGQPLVVQLENIGLRQGGSIWKIEISKRTQNIAGLGVTLTRAGREIKGNCLKGASRTGSVSTMVATIAGLGFIMGLGKYPK